MQKEINVCSLRGIIWLVYYEPARGILPLSLILKVTLVGKMFSYKSMLTVDHVERLQTSGRLAVPPQNGGSGAKPFCDLLEAH